MPRHLMPKLPTPFGQLRKRFTKENTTDSAVVEYHVDFKRLYAPGYKFKVMSSVGTSMTLLHDSKLVERTLDRQQTV